MKFKDILKQLGESRIYNINPDGSKTIEKIEKINFIHSNLQKSKGYDNVVEVSDIFHDNYKKSKNYVSMTGKKDPLSNKKIRDMLAKNNEIEYPEVSVDEEGNISFDDGQHRYGMITRLKTERLVCMSSESCDNAKKHGYIK